MEKEMNAKTLDDLVKDIVREYPGFVVPDRGFWPVNVPMIEYSREKMNILGIVTIEIVKVKYLELQMRDSKHQILRLVILL